MLVGQPYLNNGKTTTSTTQLTSTTTTTIRIIMLQNIKHLIIEQNTKYLEGKPLVTAVVMEVAAVGYSPDHLSSYQEDRLATVGWVCEQLDFQWD